MSTYYRISSAELYTRGNEISRHSQMDSWYDGECIRWERREARQRPKLRDWKINKDRLLLMLFAPKDPSDNEQAIYQLLAS